MQAYLINMYKKVLYLPFYLKFYNKINKILE